MIPLEALTASRTTTDGGSPSLRLLNPNTVLPLQPKEAEPKPHFVIDFGNGIISRDGKELTRLKSEHFLELLRRFSDQKNPPSIEELEILAQEHRLMYDRYSIMTHLSNLKRRLGGGQELIRAEKRESGTFFIFDGTIEVVDQTSSLQAKPDENTELTLETVSQLARTAEPFFVKTAGDSLMPQASDRTPEEVLTPEEVMRRVLQRGPINLISLATELNPNSDPKIAAQSTAKTLIKLSKILRREGLVIAFSGITFLGIMTPEEEKTAIQNFEEKRKPQKTTRETNLGEDTTRPDAAIDEDSPQIIVSLEKNEIFINGQIIKYKEGQQTWETFLVFLNNPGAYLSNKEINQAVFERTGQELYNGISALTNAIDERITKSERVSIFKRNAEGTALSAVVSLLLPEQEFPEEHKQDRSDNADSIDFDDSDEVLQKQIKMREALKKSARMRLESEPVHGALEQFDVRLVIPQTGKTRKIRLDINELSLLAEIIKRDVPPTVASLGKSVLRTYYTVFDERGGFEAVLMSLDKKIHTWGIALTINKETDVEKNENTEGEDSKEIETKAEVDTEKKEPVEKGTSIIKIIALTPNHEFFIEPIDAVLYDKQQEKISPRERKRQPSHGKLKL